MASHTVSQPKVGTLLKEVDKKTVTESAFDKVNIEVTEDDIAENESVFDVIEEDEDLPAIKSTDKVVTEVETVIKPDESVVDNDAPVSVTYKGVKGEGRAVAVIQVIIPLDGTKADDPQAVNTSGDFVQFKLGETRKVTRYQADWLSTHPVWDISKKS